mmetsp:Transcript_5314/g.11245  ORF Transcript_5314/g.11245 Transcript_5314/m.11245 type:complete len:725 (-) Transcript_5314:129-2303(-)
MISQTTTKGRQPSTMQRLKTNNMLFPLCCIILTCAAASELNSTTSLQHQQRRTQQMLQHLPPAPVTPFRGGLSAARSRNNNNNDSSSRNKYGYVKSNNGDGSVEASSSDYNNNNNNRHQSSSSSSLHRTHNNNIRSFSSSWTPEDFPDPWINPLLCGGAATASQLKLNQQLHPNNNHTNINHPTPTQMKRPLFCDPDQVLDKSTLRTVMMKLREFSQEFASKNFVEGGDFGLWEVDDFNEEEEEQQSGDFEEEQQQQQSDSMDGLDSSEDVHTSDENEGRPDQSTHNLRRRRLQQHHASHQDNNPIVNKHRRQLSSSSSNNNKGLSDTDTVEVAIALVQKINLPAILRADSYFFYSDQDDMVNDAAQYFARYVHDTWNRRVMQEQQTNDSSVTTNIVLIFISVHDRICYISSGTRIATILPWWRLEHVVQDMKPMLRKGHTGDALEVAIDDMTSLLRAGSPTVKDRMDDFFERFGVVLAFAFFTFLFATYGEFQDRRKRVILAERRSRMTVVEREKARSMQKEFQTKACPICLETFGGSNNESGKDDITVDANASTLTKKERARKKEQKQKMKRVDSHGIPLKGNDERPIKFLRCGHIFDESCWRSWVDSGHGNSMMCPVCRQDIGRGKRRNRQQDAGDTATSANNDGNHSGQQQSLFLRIMEHAHAATAPATLLRPINNLHTTNYGSTNYGSTLWSSTRPDYEAGLNDSSATSFYSTENTPLI